MVSNRCMGAAMPQEEREAQREIVEEAEKLLSSTEAVVEGIKSGKITAYIARKIGGAAVKKQIDKMGYQYRALWKTDYTKYLLKTRGKEGVKG